MDKIILIMVTISENLFNPLNLWLKIKISAQSAQSFRRNLFNKDIPLWDD